MTQAAQNNLNFASNLQSTGFTPYTGNQVAAFSPQQSQSFGMGTGIAGAVTPTLGNATTGLNNYMAGAANQPTVTPETISSQMSPYMNNYVAQALAPQINNLNNQEALQSQLTQGAATSAGAFGDPRATMLQQNQNAANSLQEQGLVGNAYTSAFNTAIGAGAQDVANNLNAQTTNASLYNTGLGEQLTGANAILGANTGATNLQNTLGAQQTAQTQAQLNAPYNQWLMGQQYPFQTTQLMNSSLYAGQAGAPVTTNGTSATYAPNNAGYGLVGAGIGAVGDIAAAMLAKGGPAEKGKPYIVGEKGPELMVPHQSGTVIPYEKLRDAIQKKHGVSTDGLARQLGAAA